MTGEDWVIADSGDEEEYIAPLKPSIQTHSTISDFNGSEFLLPTIDKASTISDFTMDHALNTVETSTDSILDGSVSVTALPKPKRPRPRPAFGKGRTAATSSSMGNASPASVIADAVNQISTGSFHETLLDTPFSLDIAERTLTHKRSPTASSAKRTNPAKSHDSFKHPDTVVEGSSKDIIVVISSDAENERVPSPLFDQEATNIGSTPPSSPFQPRRKKRRIRAEDFDFLEGGIDGDADNRTLLNSSISAKEPSTKKQRRCKGKGKAVAQSDDISIPKSPTARAKKRQSKAKEKAPELEFKSKEFVEDSDDDLLLVPKSSKSVPQPSHSEQASADTSVNASIDVSIEASVFAPTKTAVVSSSILPSLSATVQPSVVFSEPPSADVSAPPPSPFDPRTLQPDRSKSEKRKKKRTTLVNSSAGTTDEGGVFISGAEHEAISTYAPLFDSPSAVAPPEKKARKSKSYENGKGVELSVSLNDTGKQFNLPLLNHSDSAEKGIPDAGKLRPKESKDRKKRAIVVSSDEDEPGCASQKDNRGEMEDENTRVKESPIENKENRALPSPKGPSGKMHVTSPSKSLSVEQSRPFNPMSQVSTPKMPSRKDSMSALIRRVSSKVQSPLGTPSPAYSPLAKASRTALSRIAPLHPNRRTPPPPPPRPPAPKKSKKMLELEEKWEEELAETVEGWACMTDEERAALRRAKRDAELGYDD